MSDVASRSPGRRRSLVLRTALGAVSGWLLLGAAARAEPVAVTDDTGRTVRLAAPALRIVSLAPHTTELIYEVDAGALLVGATAYSDFPAAAARLPRVGGLAGIDIEAVVALRPDLVVAWQSGTAEAQLAQIERLGIPVFRSEPHRLDDVATTLERFGRLTGRTATGDAAARAFRERAERLRTTYGSRRPVRVFYQVWRDPLITLGGSQMVSRAIELCGGNNVFASSPTLAPQVEAEAVIQADPEVIATSTTSTDHAADLAFWEHWTGVSAVRGQRFVFLDPALITRQSSRMLIGTETLCRAIDAARNR